MNEKKIILRRKRKNPKLLGHNISHRESTVNSKFTWEKNEVISFDKSFYVM